MRALEVLGLSGSLQQRSANSALLRAAIRVAPTGMTLTVHPALDAIAPCNPELDGDGAPVPVQKLRSAFGHAQGVVIASPEYGHSMPGTLKNALDWLVGTGELAGKPVALMGASSTPTGTIRAQMALIQTLLAQAANVAVVMTVPGVRAKLDDLGEVVHAPTLRRIRETLVTLGEAIEEHQDWLVS